MIRRLLSPARGGGRLGELKRVSCSLRLKARGCSTGRGRLGRGVSPGGGASGCGRRGSGAELKSGLGRVLFEESCGSLYTRGRAATRRPREARALAAGKGRRRAVGVDKR